MSTPTRLAPLCLLILTAFSPALAADAPSRVAELVAEAKALSPLYKTPLVRDFLAATPKLPSVSPHTVYRDSARTHAWSASAAEALPDSVRAKLATGPWPASDEMKREVGDQLDLFISKNTLKNGYLHPAETVDPRLLVHLGVSDSGFVAALARAVKKGGRVLIYNLCPAAALPGKPYIPWADGRCPFSREMWMAAGFMVVEFDRDDSPAARRMGHALGWDQGDGGMKLDTDLFASWSLFQRN